LILTNAKYLQRKILEWGGECVHTEGRDPHTGLYPLTLYTKSQTQQHTHCSPGGGGVLSSEGAGRKIRIENTRESLCFFVQWARTSIEKEKQERTKNNTHSYNFLHNTQAFLARFYTRENMSDLEKWHEKLGHVGMKQIRKCNIQGLKIPKKPFRCESCIKGKIHILPHKKNKSKQSQYKTGEVLHTDLQGPYVRTLHNERYPQIFVDIVSRKVWSVKLIHKYDSDKAIKKVIDESKIITGRKIKFLRTDGDGIFGRSKTFQELKEKEQFIHERPSPYDHNQNSIIDRECRTLLEGTSTNLFRSGTPSNFWGESVDHFIFTKNHIPKHEVTHNGKKIFISPNNFHAGKNEDFNLKNLVAFGTQVTCYIPKEKREGGKTPGQEKNFDGVLVGYVNNMRGYRVWDIKKKKIREVSYNFTVISEIENFGRTYKKKSRHFLS